MAKRQANPDFMSDAEYKQMIDVINTYKERISNLKKYPECKPSMVVRRSMLLMTQILRINNISISKNKFKGIPAKYQRIASKLPKQQPEPKTKVNKATMVGGNKKKVRKSKKNDTVQNDNGDNI